jgi:methylenetetrahydrofolate dehydrogenase (NADP+)/methenyltetrahydrofolate cyclohydrolase
LHDAYEKIVQSSDKDNFLLYPFGVTADLKTRVQHISRLIDNLNEKAEVSGILLQLPMQAGLKQSADELIDRIDPLKDVDCLNISNRSRIIDHARPELIPCTPAGVLRILD